MSRSRSWVLTINNPNEEDTRQVLSLAEEAKYIIVGKETGTCGTPHYQGYVCFDNARSFEKLKKLLPRAHLQPAVASAVQNQKYCSKDGTILVEKGAPPAQGKRSDIEHIRDVLSETPRMRSVVEVARSYQSIKVAEVYLKYHESERDWKPEVRWYHGSTGSGKTRAAREWLGSDIYTCIDSIKWWEGYDGHPHVIIDDFRKDFCKFYQLLKLLDRYAYKVETKGGSRQLLARKIAITSPFDPSRIYSTREDIQQLLRRIDQIILVGTPVINEDD